MRILMVGSDPAQGLLYHPTGLAVAFKKLGHDPHVVTWGDGEQSAGLNRLLADHSVPVHKVQCLSKSRWRALAASTAGCRSLAREIGPAVVQTRGPISMYQWRATRNEDGQRRPRRVAVVAAMGSASRSSLPARLGALLLNRYADKVVALCRAERRRLRQVGVRDHLLSVVHNPLDCERILGTGLQHRDQVRAEVVEACNIDRPKLLGCFANFNPGKRHDLLITAFAHLAKQFPDWALVLAGQGATRAACEALAVEKGLAGRIHFLGRLPNDRAIPLLASMDAVAHCSNAETFGNSMVEPLLFGIPTCITSIGIGQEIEEAGAAVVVAPDSLDELLVGLKSVMEPSGDTLKLFEGAPDYVRSTFDVSIVAKQLVNLYQADS